MATPKKTSPDVHAAAATEPESNVISRSDLMDDYGARIENDGSLLIYNSFLRHTKVTDDAAHSEVVYELTFHNAGAEYVTLQFDRTSLDQLAEYVNRLPRIDNHVPSRAR